ncbi:MAG: hypothetical protein V3V13_04580 [Paracoccaceae bacterium]
MKYIFVLILTFATPAFAQENLANIHAGLWHGVGVQIDGPDWEMQLTLGDGATMVAYPTLDCGGEWQDIKVDATQILAVERITYGMEDCLDGGLIRLQEYGEGMLIYHWFDNSGKALAAAVLLRGEMRDDTYNALHALTLEAVGKGFIMGPDMLDIDIGEIRI